MAWLHAVRLPWSGLRCGKPFPTSSQGFPETVGCYDARSVLSNIDCVISKQLFLQQFPSLQSTRLYTKNIFKNMTLNFENLFAALWGLHRARIGQRNGIMFSTSGICVWITAPVPVEFLSGHISARFNTGTLLRTLQI